MFSIPDEGEHDWQSGVLKKTNSCSYCIPKQSVLCLMSYVYVLCLCLLFMSDVLCVMSYVYVLCLCLMFMSDVLCVLSYVLCLCLMFMSYVYV